MKHNSAQIFGAINLFKSRAFEDYSREGSDFQFIEVNRKLNIIAGVLDVLADSIPEDLPKEDKLIDTIIDAIGQFNNICNEILGFEPKKNPIQTSESIVRSTESLYNSLFIPDSSSKFSSLPGIASLKEKKIPEVSEILSEAQNVKDLEERLSKLVEQAESYSRRKVASDYAKIFEDEADRHSTKLFGKTEGDNGKSDYKPGIAQFALLGLFSTLIAITVLVFCDFLIIPGIDELEGIRNELAKNLGLIDITYSELLIPYYIKKSILLVILLFVTRFFYRQYSIHKNLSELNKQRASSLTAFDFFYKQLESDESGSKEQYLIEVAKAIFTVKDTGFIKSDGSEKSFIDSIKILQRGE